MYCNLPMKYNKIEKRKILNLSKVKKEKTKLTKSKNGIKEKFAPKHLMIIQISHLVSYSIPFRVTKSRISPPPTTPAIVLDMTLN